MEPLAKKMCGKEMLSVLSVTAYPANEDMIYIQGLIGDGLGFDKMIDEPFPWAHEIFARNGIRTKEEALGQPTRIAEIFLDHLVSRYDKIQETVAAIKQNR